MAEDDIQSEEGWTKNSVDNVEKDKKHSIASCIIHDLRPRRSIGLSYEKHDFSRLHLPERYGSIDKGKMPVCTEYSVEVRAEGFQMPFVLVNDSWLSKRFTHLLNENNNDVDDESMWPLTEVDLLIHREGTGLRYSFPHFEEFKFAIDVGRNWATLMWSSHISKPDLAAGMHAFWDSFMKRKHTPIDWYIVQRNFASLCEPFDILSGKVQSLLVGRIYGFCVWWKEGQSPGNMEFFSMRRVIAQGFSKQVWEGN